VCVCRDQILFAKTHEFLLYVSRDQFVCVMTHLYLQGM